MILLFRLLASKSRCFTTLLAIWLAGAHAHAQYRVVSYNTAGGPRSGMDVILKSMGEFNPGDGISRPIDILLLQEQTFPSTTQSIVDLLNSTYSGQTFAGQSITYTRGNLGGDTTGAGTQTIIYRQQTMQLLDEATIGTTSSSGQARQTLREHVQPVGTTGSDFYIYNSHFKASQGADCQGCTTDEVRRNVEAQNIRADADALGANQHIMYAGDFNLYTAGEAAFQTLLSAGNGQAIDPLGLTAYDNNSSTKLSGEWHTNQTLAVKSQHTQSPCVSGGCIGTAGGMDDRFDFQLMSGSFLSGTGLTLVGNSYNGFGNNGSTYGGNINSASNTITFTGVTTYTKTQILNALWGVSDHLPVMADYEFSTPPPPPPPPPQTIAKFTFETSLTSSTSSTGTDFGPLNAEEGSGTVKGHHASASTSWSSPAGNGSARSFSSNHWAAGDYYQIQVSTNEMKDISLSFDATSSGTGPRDFRIDFSTDGVNFTPTGLTYMVVENTGSIAWNMTTGYTNFTNDFDLSGIPDLNDKANIYLRLVMNSSVSANGGAIGTTGSSRLDNVTIIGTPYLPGDFNGDGAVNAADYVWWRKSGGSAQDYNTWRKHFGEVSMSGAGGTNSTSVPEPTGLLLLVLGSCLAAIGSRCGA